MCFPCGDRGKNNSTAAHAGRKRLRKWVPDAWGYSWATLPRELQIRWTGHPGWGLGDWRTTCHRNKRQHLGNLKRGLGTVRLSGIDLDRGNGLMR